MIPPLSSQPPVGCLLNLSEDGVTVRVDPDDAGVRLYVSISYRMVIAFQWHWVTLSLSRAEFQAFIDALGQPEGSRLGDRSLWRTRQIILHPKNISAERSRAITIYRREFLFGFYRVPGVFSTRIVQALRELGLSISPQELPV